MSARKQLVVNADDFGFTPNVNSGIVEAHRGGILTAATLMANGEAFEDAVRLALRTPTLDIGCHLVLIGGTSLATGRPLPLTVPQLVRSLARGGIEPYEEMAAQVRRILQAGLRPTHLDTHKHTHLAPPVLQAVARIGAEFGIPWIRRPFDFPLKAAGSRRLLNAAMGLLRPYFRRVLALHGCRATGHFAGFGITGRFRTAELVELMAAIPEGTTELMCHPGRCGEALRRAPTRLKQSREAELEALVSPEVRAAVARHGIELVNYAGLR